jgi:hypothetical protein
MNPQKANINTNLFARWSKEMFVPIKAPGHSSHCSSPELFQLANGDDVIMLILPSHSVAALQPLDRDIFGPFKTFLKQDANHWVNNHQNRNVPRWQIGILIGGAWNRAA